MKTVFLFCMIIGYTGDKVCFYPGYTFDTMEACEAQKLFNQTLKVQKDHPLWILTGKGYFCEEREVLPVPVAPGPSAEVATEYSSIPVNVTWCGVGLFPKCPKQEWSLPEGWKWAPPPYDGLMISPDHPNQMGGYLKIPPPDPAEGVRRAPQPDDRVYGFYTSKLEKDGTFTACPLAILTADGQVTIDWSCGDDADDTMHTAMFLILKAVRDGTARNKP